MRAVRILLCWVLILGAPSAVVWAAPQFDSGEWPPGARWNNQAYRLATRHLTALANAGKPLPRMTEGMPGREFERFLTPGLMTSDGSPRPVAEVELFLGLTRTIEKAQWVYLKAATTDPSCSHEVGALFSVESRFAREIATRLKFLPDGRLRAAASEVIVGCMAGMMTLSRDVPTASAGGDALIMLFEILAHDALANLSPACRRELALRKEATAPLAPRLPERLQIIFRNIKASNPRDIPPRLKSLLDAGLPAPDRSWAADDLALAVNVLSQVSAQDRTRLPRLSDPQTAPVVRRLASVENLHWLEDEDVALADRVLVAGRFQQLIAGAGSVYTPYFSVQPQGAKPEDFQAEDLALTGYQFEILRHALRLEERFESTLNPTDASTFLKKLAFAAARRVRPAQIKLLLQSMVPLDGPCPDERRRFLQTLARTLPDMLERLTPDGRADVIASVRASPPPRPGSPVARAFAALLKALAR